MTLTPEFWRRCSSCKNPIAYKAKHYVCSVSTCTRKRTGYVFCSVHCWERHLPGARHRDAAAIEAIGPTFEEWKRELADEESGSSDSNATTPHAAAGPSQPAAQPQSSAQKPAMAEGKRFIVRESPNTTAPTTKNPPPPKEILIVASKLKAYIRARSEMNTSDSVMDILSDQVRRLCDDAIDRAREEGRKTVLDRDFKKKD